MANHNHTGSVWSNVSKGANVREGPGTNFPTITDTLPLKAGTPVVILCYSLGEEIVHLAPDGVKYKSRAWDYVVTTNGDRGYVADVLINTGGDIIKQMGQQGTCKLVGQRLMQSAEAGLVAEQQQPRG